jgi:phosphatidylserine decarboxylase
MAIGMAEVSSCEVVVQVGQHIKKGQTMGQFHFGGSTHCLLFEKGVELTWQLGQEPGVDAHNIKLSTPIATVKQTKQKKKE